VLYVEDQEEVAAIGRAMLERLGYRVTYAANGGDALELFRDDPDAYDLVVTDQTMPILTGADLARELLRLRPNLPIVLMSGFSEAITPDSARDLGIRGLVKKPIVTRDLAVTLRNALDGANQPSE
jgi:CheY-like chemotaxis protein